jgi:hypothetical protein
MTDCPICTVTLNNLTEIQIQSHVSSCLDSSATLEYPTAIAKNLGLNYLVKSLFLFEAFGV